jgi:hypothetical protein
MTEQGDMFGGNRLLSDARREVMQGRWDTNGIICPCCDGKAKVYPRPFNSAMAKHLVYLWRWDLDGPGRYHHVKNRLVELSKKWFNAEFARMEDYWLIEAAHDVRPDGNPDTGHYRITEHGKDFVEGRVTIKSHARCYKSKVLEFTGKDITIHDALGLHFDYEKVVRAPGRPDEGLPA